MAEPKPSRNPITRLKEASIPYQIAAGLGAIIGVFLLTLIVAVIFGIATGDSEDVSAIVAIIRDLFIILLAMQGMVVTLALVVLILQLAALINLFQNEVNPIVKNLQDTANTVKGTAEFLSENITAPVIETSAWVRGITTFTKEIAGLTKALRGNGKTTPEEQKKDESTSP